MESGARAPGRGHARTTVPRQTIVALGAELVERTGTCGRSEHEASGGHARCMCERRCKARDAVTVALAAALCASHLHDGAGARAVAAEMMLAPR